MSIDIYQKSEKLLSKIANSLYDRDPSLLSNPNPILFSIQELRIVEDWIEELIKEITKKIK